jgi:hypothetical protein
MISELTKKTLTKIIIYSSGYSIDPDYKRWIRMNLFGNTPYDLIGKGAIKNWKYWKNGIFKMLEFK